MTRLAVAHSTIYRYDAPVALGLQQLRMTPKSRAGQQVNAWEIEVDGGRIETAFDDQHANRVHLVSLEPGTREVTLTARGEVEVSTLDGITGPHAGHMPLWLFLRETDMTPQGPNLRRMLRGFDAPPAERLDMLHALSAHVLGHVAYASGSTQVGQDSEAVIEAGRGVCQGHAHVFLAAARSLGVPARYVSGYLMMDDRVEQEAMHAWAEAHVDGLGWVGFDVSNGISPDIRYVRVATGLDYGECAPVHGLRRGAGSESLSVGLRVEAMAQGQRQQ
jgi:transglutaminase-like putative cysteine protease